jgi:hypothetical protein
MLTFRNLLAVGLFLFGSTFLWMTASFTGETPPPEGAIWTLENVLALLAVLGFTAAAWGVFKDLSWWEPVTAISGVVGLIAVIPFVIGVSGLAGSVDLGVAINLTMHVFGSGAVLAIVFVPSAHDWIMGSL